MSDEQTEAKPKVASVEEKIRKIMLEAGIEVEGLDLPEMVAVMALRLGKAELSVREWQRNFQALRARTGA